MFDNITRKFEETLKKLKGEHKLTELNMAEPMKDLRRALLDADVSYDVAKRFIAQVKKDALGSKVYTQLNPEEALTKIIYDKLTDLMGSERVEMNTDGHPAVVLMSGLQGSGKTTLSGKIALLHKKQQPLLVACDVYRPAAITQLQVVGERIGVPVYTEPGNSNPVEIALHGIEHAKEEGLDLVIIDTAGRLAVDDEMMDEIAAIKDAVKPSETLFVVDSMTGQDAVNTAKAFNDRLNIDGVAITKLDGDTRGGAALSICSVVRKPIKFIGTGEKMQDISPFNPRGMASRILGRGDLEDLLDKIQRIEDEISKEEEERLAKGEFDFYDFRKQIKNIKRMGSLKSLIQLIPGMSKLTEGLNIDDNAFIAIEAMIDSMTPAERRKPEIINRSRINRIAAGSGKDPKAVQNLMYQFMQMRQMMVMMSNPMAAMKAGRNQGFGDEKRKGMRMNRLGKKRFKR